MLAAAAFCVTPLMADTATLVYETTGAEEASFDLDTLLPHTHASGVAESIPYAAGVTVTETDPDGTQTVRVSSPAAAGTLSWNPAQGGIWTLANSLEGSTTFTVRHPASTRGAGTAADPAKIMDAAELVDLGVGSGYVFRLCGADWLADALQVPSGCSLSDLGDGVWRLDTSTDGCVCTAVDADFLLDTELPGPDRRAHVRNTMPFAYSGDDWGGSASAESTLTFTPPDGVEAPDPVVCLGWGTCVPSFRFKPGIWTVSLTGDSVTPQSAQIEFLSDGFFIIVAQNQPGLGWLR